MIRADAKRSQEEDKLKYNQAFIGKWEQESMESSKLEAILKKQGFPWVVRSIALSTKLNMTFSVDDDGDLLYSSRVPVQGEQLVHRLPDPTQIQPAPPVQ